MSQPAFQNTVTLGNTLLFVYQSDKLMSVHGYKYAWYPKLSYES